MSAATAPSAGDLDPDGEWHGGYRRYDIVKEFVIALVVVSLLTVGLAVLLGSPDEQPLTLGAWARADAKDFVATAITELDHTSEVAQYGPPYTNTPNAAQKIGPVSLQGMFGDRIMIDTARDFVTGPLAIERLDDPRIASALSQWNAATPSQRADWTKSYEDAADKATVSNGSIQLPPGDYGPVAPMMQGLLSMAQSGGLDGALLSTNQFYQTDYTKPILFMSGGSYFEHLAEQQHLLGTQWGMMNETGNWPGQPWLWLYTFWYQIKPFSTSGNADALVWGLMLVLTAVLVFLPFIPGLRSIPKWIPVHRLIWRDYYRSVERPGTNVALPARD